jgi:hypothetical protein
LVEEEATTDAQADGIGKQAEVNFTNILCVGFSYVSFARSFFVLVVKDKLFIGARKLAQLRS